MIHCHKPNECLDLEYRSKDFINTQKAEGKHVRNHGEGLLQASHSLQKHSLQC